jgi:hypothetical protein
LIIPKRVCCEVEFTIGGSRLSLCNGSLRAVLLTAE